MQGLLFNCVLEWTMHQPSCKDCCLAMHFSELCTNHRARTTLQLCTWVYQSIVHKKHCRLLFVIAAVYTWSDWRPSRLDTGAIPRRSDSDWYFWRSWRWHADMFQLWSSWTTDTLWPCQVRTNVSSNLYRCSQTSAWWVLRLCCYFFVTYPPSVLNKKSAKIGHVLRNEYSLKMPVRNATGKYCGVKIVTLFPLLRVQFRKGICLTTYITGTSVQGDHVWQFKRYKSSKCDWCNSLWMRWFWCI